MILLLGATTYIGHSFARALRGRRDSFIPLSRETFDYAQFESLFDYVRKVKPDLLINADEIGALEGSCDGLVVNGHPAPVFGDGVPASQLPAGPALNRAENDRTHMLQINTVLPQTVARVCAMTNTAFGHVSSGSIYLGAKISENGTLRIEEDLGSDSVRALLRSRPEALRGFTELDGPNFSFNSAPCTFYSGTKALAEEALRDNEVYIWRFRLPFNELEDSNNFLCQFQDGMKMPDAINSVSHVDDCVAACLQLWEARAPLGVYNVVNPGPISTQDLARMIQRILKPARRLELMVFDENPSPSLERALRSDCVLDTSKLVSAGIKLREARLALEYSLQKWAPQSASALKTVS